MAPKTEAENFTALQVKALNEFFEHCAKEIEKDMTKVKETMKGCNEPWTKMLLAGLAIDQESLVQWFRDKPLKQDVVGKSPEDYKCALRDVVRATQSVKSQLSDLSPKAIAEQLDRIARLANRELSDKERETIR